MNLLATIALLLTLIAPEPPLAVTASAVNPGNLRPWQAFTIAAAVFSASDATSTIVLTAPDWLIVSEASKPPVTTSAEHPALILYAAQVKPGTPLDARGVVTFTATDQAGNTASHSFVVALCCAEQPPPKPPKRIVRLPIVRR